MRLLSCILVHPLILLITTCITRSSSAAECLWNTECEVMYSAGSVCRDDGTCSNPYAAGCLYNFGQNYGRLSGTTEKRVCNTDDDDETYCKASAFDYTEVRVHNGDWESPIFYSWITQIFLSEFLHVPVTVGLSNDTHVASFYNPDGIMTWSSQTYAWDELIVANNMLGRCDLTDEQCVHVIPEVWMGQQKKWQRFFGEGHIDQVNGNGEVGKIGWYVPFATAKRHPEVVSFHGMENRREEMASIFLRPTTWGDYCNEESSDGCQGADGVASRAPEEGEDDMYFLDGVFTGFFRETDENNCTANPDTCTGHIADCPCTWDTYVDAQTFHNNISLKSNGPNNGNHGYSYDQMIQIWRAANATDSDVIMWWWFPDATVEEFRGTAYEFQPVLLPEPTAECRLDRIEPEDRCSVFDLMRQGEPLGGCDNESNDLKMVIASSLRELSYNASEVEKSPAYEALRNLKVSQIDMNVMLGQWAAKGRTGFAAREAVCTWVIEHIDDLESFIPNGFPRTIEEYTSYNEPMLYVAITFAIVAFVYVLVALGVVYMHRKKKVFIYAQIPFVNMVLGGLLLVSITAFFFALEPSTAVCTTRVWFLSLGYTLELVPLLVKVAAINRLMAATKRMRRAQISMQSLYATVAVVIFVVFIYLLCWTFIDRPYGAEGRYLTEDNTIKTTVSCKQDSGAWDMIVLLWNGILIVCASMLAFQSRNVKQEFNESHSLGVMIYSHFVLMIMFVVLWLVGQGGDDEVPTLDTGKARAACSMLMSFDVVSAITIYIVPKVLEARKRERFIPNASFRDSFDGPSFENALQGSSGSLTPNGTSSSSHHVFQPSGGKRMPSGPSMPSINERSDEDEESSYSANPRTSSRDEGNEDKEERKELDADKPNGFVPHFSRVSADGSLSSPPESLPPVQVKSNFVTRMFPILRDPPAASNRSSADSENSSQSHSSRKRMFPDVSRLHEDSLRSRDTSQRSSGISDDVKDESQSDEVNN